MSTTSYVSINSDMDDNDDEIENLCEYPPNVEGRISISKADLQSLEENNFLNDQIISKCVSFFVIFLPYSVPGILPQVST